MNVNVSFDTLIFISKKTAISRLLHNIPYVYIQIKSL
jgi:hypothetical protein